MIFIALNLFGLFVVQMNDIKQKNNKTFLRTSFGSTAKYSPYPASPMLENKFKAS